MNFVPGPRLRRRRRPLLARHPRDGPGGAARDGPGGAAPARGHVMAYHLPNDLQNKLF